MEESKKVEEVGEKIDKEKVKKELEKRKKKKEKESTLLENLIAFGLGLYLASRGKPAEAEELPKETPAPTVPTIPTIPTIPTVPTVKAEVDLGDLHSILVKILETIIKFPEALDKIEQDLDKMIARLEEFRKYLVSDKYDAGELEVRDVAYHLVWGGEGSRSVAFHAESHDFEIKILTAGDRKEGKSLDEVDIIYLSEGLNFEANINAVQIWARCPSATSDSPGILFWEVSL